MGRGNRQPGLGDVALPDIERPHFNVESLSERNSFAKAVTPEYHDLHIEDYADLTTDHIKLITPDFMRKHLFDVNREASNAVYYQDPRTEKSTWIAVTPLEFSQTAGNIETLGKTVMSRVSASRASRRDFGPDREAAVRGGVHAVEGKLEKLNNYRHKTLNRQGATLEWLEHAAKHPGYAWKNGIDVRMSIAEARFGVFDDMITAVSIAGKWSPESTERLRKVMEYKLFFDRQNNQHIENWKEFLAVGQEYLGYKKAIYSEKIEKAKRYIKANAQQVS